MNLPKEKGINVNKTLKNHPEKWGSNSNIIILLMNAPTHFLGFLRILYNNPPHRIFGNFVPL